MKIVTNWRNSVNARLAKRLEESCARFGLPYDGEKVTDLGDCLLQLHFKPAYLLWKLETLQEDFCWVDPWAEIVKPPLLIDKSGNDISAFKCGDVYWSGTIVVRNTKKTRDTLQAWIEENKAQPWHGDVNWTTAIKKVRPIVHHLPETYCWLSASFPKAWPKSTPVIAHHPEETICLPQAT